MSATRLLPLTFANSEYPEDWPHIARRVKEQAEWKCRRCRHPSDFTARRVLSVHHLDGDKTNCADWNLVALCQRCHLSVQNRVRLSQLTITEVMPIADWFRPHFEGYLNSRSSK